MMQSKKAKLKALLGVTVFVATLILGLSFLSKLQKKGDSTVTKALSRYQKQINPYIKIFGISHHPRGTKIKKVLIQSPYLNLTLNHVEINQNFISLSVLWQKLESLKLTAKTWTLTSKYLSHQEVHGHRIYCVVKSGQCKANSDHGDLQLGYRVSSNKKALKVSYNLKIKSLRFAQIALSSRVIEIPEVGLSGSLTYFKKTKNFRVDKNKLALHVGEKEKLHFSLGLLKVAKNLSLQLEGRSNSCQAFSKLIHLLDKDREALSFQGTVDFAVDLRKIGGRYKVNLPKFADRCVPIQKSPTAIKIKQKFASFKRNQQAKRRWVSYGDVSPAFLKSVVLAEDGGFFSHSGVLERTLLNSLVRNINDGKFTLGGSTITMQTVKNFLLSNRKQISRKLYEIMAAKTVEKLFSKKEILEYYINRIEFGPQIYGVREAASFYFSKTPKRLHGNESAFLASILTNPKIYFKQNFCERKFKPGLSRKMRKISKGLLRHGLAVQPLGYSREFFHKKNRNSFCRFAGKN